MSLLDDTAIFAAVVQQGSFSRAAKHLGLSNGLISRRIAQLESQLGVALIVRTTRQLHLTPEGELFWEHAYRIQQELNSAVSLIQSLSTKPRGTIRLSAPHYVGRHCIAPLITKFLQNFEDIHIDLILTNEYLDLVKENLDLIIRGVGYVHNNATLADSSLHAKLLFPSTLGLYASSDYLYRYGEPRSVEELEKHAIIGYTDKVHLPEHHTWSYSYKGKQDSVIIRPKFNCNDIEISITACKAGLGIGRFLVWPMQQAVENKEVRPILTDYDWGTMNVYAFYAQQKALPQRTRLLLEFISTQLECCTKKVSG